MSLSKTILRKGFIFLLCSLLLYKVMEDNTILKQNSNGVVDRSVQRTVFFLQAKYLGGPLCPEQGQCNEIS